MLARRKDFKCENFEETIEFQNSIQIRIIPKTQFKSELHLPTMLQYPTVEGQSKKTTIQFLLKILRSWVIGL